MIVSQKALFLRILVNLILSEISLCSPQVSGFKNPPKRAAGLRRSLRGFLYPEG